MAWLAKGKTHQDLVKQLQDYGILKKKEAMAAMLKVDRKDFCPKDPYDDSPQYIGHGATISAPHMHAYALETLFERLQPNCHVLDVGSGSGYLVACFAHMVGEKGKVIGIDHMKELCALSLHNLSKNHEQFIKSKNIEIIHGDGRKGYERKDCAPYDCIHVGAAAAPEVPEILCKQLKPGGLMVIPVEMKKNSQIFRFYKKDEKGKVTYKDMMDVRYVALTDEKSQRKKEKAFNAHFK